MKESLKSEIKKLTDEAQIVYVSSVNQQGFPNTKAMLYIIHGGLKTHYLSTNYSSKRVAQFLENPKACLYFCNEAAFKGLMLTGTMEICTDRSHKEMLWKEGFEMYYPNGIDDEDYCVFKFTATEGNYYHGLSNITFPVEEL
jgi:general stress protein 26